MPGTRLTTIALACCALLAGACGSSTASSGQSSAPSASASVGGTQQQPGLVTRSRYGKRWPFTVPRGVVSCDDHGGVVFTTPDGTAYWLNGTAGGEHNYRDVHPIWRKDPAIPGLRINIGPMINLGLRLCSG
jgi:Protein of unknown function (DUF2511)